MTKISSLILFGSHARGDVSETSDTDILGICGDGPISTSSSGKVNLSVYPEEYFLRMAEEGDLFLLHIVREGRALFDPLFHLERAQHAFRFKDDYSIEGVRAANLGWYLVHNLDAVKNKRVAAKRVAWVVRTILIARSVDEGRPIFSASQLAATAPNFDVAGLIACKEAHSLSPGVGLALEALLRGFGYNEPDREQPNSIWSQREAFEKQGNLVAAGTLLDLIRDQNAELYG